MNYEQFIMLNVKEKKLYFKATGRVAELDVNNFLPNIGLKQVQ